MTVAVSRTRAIAVPVDDVWQVLADFGALARWAPDVEHSCLLHAAPGADGPGTGAVRRVQVGRATLLETVTAWSPPERLAYDIAGLPPVLRRVTNEWRLEPAGDGTEVTLTTAVDAGARPPQRLVARLVARRLARTSTSMLASLDAALTSGDHTRA